MFKFVAATVGKTVSGVKSFHYRLRRVQHVDSNLSKIGCIKDITGIVFVQNGAKESMYILFFNTINIYFLKVKVLL